MYRLLRPNDSTTVASERAKTSVDTSDVVVMIDLVNAAEENGGGGG